MDDLQARVLAAKADDLLFSDLAEEHKEWILRCASQAARRHITDSDDEWSVALMAFSEAVQSYEAGKGSFRGLAAVVIRRRVTDHLRREGRHGAEIAVLPGAFEGTLEADEAVGTELRVRQTVAAASMTAAADDSVQRAREEIAGMQGILREYGFSFFDLAEASPKAEKTKKSCALAIRTLAASAVLMLKMRLKRLLPILELSRESGVVRKILERHRKYIIAGAEILDGDFPILASYLRFVKEG